MIVGENAHHTQSTLISLETTIRNLKDLPGQKLVVLVSDGFYLGGTSASKVYDIRRVTDAATRAGAVIYSIDSRGLVATLGVGDASVPSGLITDLPGVREPVVAYWKDRAAGLESRIRNLKRDPGSLAAIPEVRLFVESGPDRHLELAGEAGDLVTREISARGDPRTILEALERELQHLVYARECLVEPTSRQKMALDSLPLSVDRYRRQVFASR